MISVEEALRRILDGTTAMPVENVALAAPVAALLTQPPFDASAMDGFAVRGGDVVHLPARLALIGEAAAGHPFAGGIAAGQCVRIFTGAPLPAGADAVVIQENVRCEGASVVVEQGVPDGGHVRARGLDFREGEVLLAPGRGLGPREIALAAAMGHGSLPVHRRPRVAVLATGDEQDRSSAATISAWRRWRARRGQRWRCSASPATRPRACMPTSRWPKEPTSSSPLAACRLAITTSWHRY